MPSPVQVARPRLDLSRYELTVNARRVRLERQPMELLILLAQRKGRLVSRDEIVEKLWGKDVFVDVDRSVNAAIRKIRAALRDDSTAPKYLETVVGKGYRFVGDMEVVGAAPDLARTSSSPIDPVSQPRGKILRRLPRMALVVVLVAAAWAGWKLQVRQRTQATHAHSIAVLPLENLSHDPDQEYFAEGMTEELTTELAQVSALKVISHTSVVQYKGTKKSLPQIARELNVDEVVEGAVQRSGEKVEITVQLIQGTSDRHLWAKSYERSLGDVLDLQREVTHAITDEISAKLTPTEKVRLASTRSVGSEAYDDYLKGRFLLTTFGESDARKAIAYFGQSIQKDPHYPLAYAGIAEAWITLGQPWNGGLPPRETLPQAKAAATKALELDDSLSEAHSALAHVIELYDWDWQNAEKQYQKALELNPNDATAHFWYGEYLQATARNEEGFTQMRQAIALDPLNAAPVAELGSQLYMARQYDDAIQAFQKTFEVEPNYIWAHTGLGWVYSARKMHHEAIAELAKAVDLSNRNDDALASLAKALGESGRTREARKILEELTVRSKQRYVSPYLVALVQTGLGERNQAIASLEEGYTNRDQWMIYLKADPMWDDLRSDPRFTDLLRRVGLLQ